MLQNLDTVPYLDLIDSDIEKNMYHISYLHEKAQNHLLAEHVLRMMMISFVFYFVCFHVRIN